jgi:acetyltransferase-like isoleucine patch superfamily enzyme
MMDQQPITDLIAGFSVDPGAWRELAPADFAGNGISLEGGAAPGLRIFVRDGLCDLQLTVRAPDVRGGRLFLGNNLGGSLRLALRSDNATVFIGDNGRFNGLELRSRQPDDLIAIGNDVAVTGPGTWISGLAAGSGRPALVVGDCCLIAGGVTLRNSDGHPVLRRVDGAVTNAPRRDLLIEPHAWLGERCAVLKDVTVGAFARIAYGSVVTRDVPRYAVARGVPARSEVQADRYWAWDETAAGRARAADFLARFPAAD